MVGIILYGSDPHMLLKRVDLPLPDNVRAFEDVTSVHSFGVAFGCSITGVIFAAISFTLAILYPVIVKWRGWQDDYVGTTNFNLG